MWSDGVIVHKESGLCLDAAAAGAGSKISLETCTGAMNQAWKELHTEGRPAEWAQFASLKYEGMCVDIGGGAANPGQKIQTWTCRTTIPSLERDNFEYKWV